MSLTQIINSQVTEFHLCEDCARERGLLDPKALTFSEKFYPQELQERVDRLIEELCAKCFDTPPKPAVKRDLITKCPACGFSLDDIRRTNRLGCPACYSVFAREFCPYELPERPDTPTKSTPDIPQRVKLERQLSDAIAREDYETAARLRDELKTLQS